MPSTSQLSLANIVEFYEAILDGQDVDLEKECRKSDMDSELLVKVLGKLDEITRVETFLDSSMAEIKGFITGKNSLPKWVHESDACVYNDIKIKPEKEQHKSLDTIYFIMKLTLYKLDPHRHLDSMCPVCLEPIMKGRTGPSICPRCKNVCHLKCSAVWVDQDNGSCMFCRYNR